MVVTISNKATVVHMRAKASPIFLRFILLIFLLDIGEFSVFAFSGAHHYVDADAVAGGDGSSWESAFKNLQDALDQTVPGRGDELWIAAGDYFPDAGSNVTRGDRSASFVLKNKVTLYGGFIGAETVLEQRDFHANKVTLSGKISADKANWSLHVCSVADGGSVVLDGLTITGGNANGTEVGADKAAAVRGLSSNYSVMASNCSFIGNSATEAGGVAYEGSWTVENCIFDGNTAFHGGVARYGTWTATDCIFSKNSGYHGGVCMEGTWLASRCSFNGNSAAFGGVAFRGICSAVECTFSGNSVSNEGGVGAQGNWGVSKSTFLGNSASVGGGVGSNGQWSVSESRFQENSSYSGGVGYGGEWTLLSSSFGGNSGWAGGAVATFGKWAVNNCVFTRNSSRSGSVSHKSSWIVVGSTFNANFGNIADSSDWAILNSVFGEASFFFVSNVRNYVSQGEPRAKNIIRGSETAFVGNVDLGVGMIIDADLRFIDATKPAGADGVFGTADDGLRLRAGSPAIGQGNADFLPEDTFDLDKDGNTTEALPVDFAGRQRVQDGNLDLGAYEYQVSEKPSITLIGGNPLEVYLDSVFTDPGAKVVDDSDADRTILGAGLVNATILGTYTLTYDTQDNDGNVADTVTRIVNVVLDPAEDEDSDGLSNGLEATLGSDPTLRDSNSDEIEDGRAHSLGYNPTLSMAALIGSLRTNPVSGLFTQAQYDANRTNGQADVTTNPSAFSLYTQEQCDALAALQFSNGQSSVTTNPSSFGLYTQDEREAYDVLQFSNGQSSVMTNPSAFGLFTQAQHDERYTAGVVTALASVPAVEVTVPAPSFLRIGADPEQTTGLVFSNLPAGWSLDGEAGVISGFVDGDEPVSTRFLAERGTNAPVSMAVTLIPEFMPIKAVNVLPPKKNLKKGQSTTLMLEVANASEQEQTIEVQFASSDEAVVEPPQALSVTVPGKKAGSSTAAKVRVKFTVVALDKGAAELRASYDAAASAPCTITVK